MQQREKNWNWVNSWSSKEVWGKTYKNIYEVGKKDCAKHGLQKPYRILNFLQSLSQNSENTEPAYLMTFKGEEREKDY